MKGPILLVDDELNILRALERMFRRNGYDVLTADSGAKGLELLSSHDCPVIISDFRMPEMSGAQFLQQARKLSPQSVAMILSGYADFNSVIAVLNDGLAFKFLQKPWLEQQLLTEIESAFLHGEQQKDQSVRTQLLIGSQDALIECNHQGTLLRYNAAAQALLQLPANELSNSPLSTLFRDWNERYLPQLLAQQIWSAPVENHSGKGFDLALQRIDQQTLLLRLDPIQTAVNSTSQFVDHPTNASCCS